MTTAARALSGGELLEMQGILPDVRAKFDALRAAAARENILLEVPPFGGLRTEADQAKLVGWRDEAVARGEPWYPVAPFGRSFHERGAALDVKIVGAVNGGDPRYARLGILGESVGFRWGGRFQRADVFHFELPTTLTAARAQFVAFAQGTGGTVALVVLGAALAGVVLRGMV